MVWMKPVKRMLALHQQRTRGLNRCRTDLVSPTRDCIVPAVIYREICHPSFVAEPSFARYCLTAKTPAGARSLVQTPFTNTPHHVLDRVSFRARPSKADLIVRSHGTLQRQVYSDPTVVDPRDRAEREAALKLLLSQTSAFAISASNRLGARRRLRISWSTYAHRRVALPWEVLAAPATVSSRERPRDREHVPPARRHRLML